MKKIIISTILLFNIGLAEELQVKSKTFHADRKAGVSVFEGNVNIIKGTDELNATKVTIYTDKNEQPTKFVADGNASFNIITEDGSMYKGKSQKAIYLPKEKEYHFYTDVHLKQINEKKEIIGEEVILKTIEGKAYAKGADKEPVIMIFNLPEDDKDEKKMKND